MERQINYELLDVLTCRQLLLYYYMSDNLTLHRLTIETGSEYYFKFSMKDIEIKFNTTSSRIYIDLKALIDNGLIIRMSRRNYYKVL